MAVSQTSHILYMAPMLGITDSAYRTAFMKCFGGFDLAITPFVKTLQGGRCEDNKMIDFLPSRNPSLPIFPQILSNNSEDFIAVAKAIFDLGYERININLGCPVPMAAGRGRGAGLLPHPEFVDRLLDDILNAIPNQLSIKTRVGFDSPDQLLAMTKVLNRYPLFEIAVHPRTAKQGYGGTVNHEAFTQVMQELKTSVIYSGDINTLNDFLLVKARYPRIRKWMLGRGALADPWLPQKIRKHLAGDDGESFALKPCKLRAFYSELIYQFEVRDFEPSVILSRLKSLFYYHADHLGFEAQLVRSVRKTKNLDDFFSSLQ